jgi:peptidoglycan/LPS O-acetylase OafA/YrhL
MAATFATVLLSVAFYRRIEAPLLSAMRRKLRDQPSLTARTATAALENNAS